MRPDPGVGSARLHFFTRSSKEVCEAILSAGDQHSNDVLRRHVERIANTRLRRAFLAALDLQ
jgi:hypothetical protein